MLKLLRIVCLVMLLFALNALAEDPQSIAAVQHLGQGFQSGFAEVNGTTLHYVRGGHGPAVILLHGFPEDWFEFRKVMPRLASSFTVVAVDLRGVGESSVAAKGFDAANLADDVHQLAAQIGLEHSYVVGHDIGGMVAYALARRYPSDLRGVMLLDIAFPGMDPWPQIEVHPAFWHVRFHQTDLPEKLVAGRQKDYFRYFLAAPLFTDADVAHYSKAYDAEHLSTAFEFYRAFTVNAKFYAEQNDPLPLPFVLGAGERDAFAPFVPQIAAAMRAHGCKNVRTTIIGNSMHYVFEEQPDAVGKLISEYAAQ